MMIRTKRDTLVLQVGVEHGGVDPTPEKKFYVQKTSEMPRTEIIDEDLATRT
jgi:hypothetical protein